MCLSSNKNSDSLCQCCFELLIQLIDADSVYEVMYWLVIWFAPEDNCNIEGYKDIIVSWTCSNWELVSDILLCNQELNLGPRQAWDEAALSLDWVEFAVFSDNRVSSFGAILSIQCIYHLN